jgi:hypothetical protein
MEMKLAHWLCVLGLLLVMGCLPNPVSVSKDGTIALTLSESGEFSLIQGEREQVYLTNANADFLEKVEGMDKGRTPAISPSGKYVLACSDKELLLHDRKTKKTRAIYRARDDDSDGAINFPVWSPDERKIAFFAEGFDPDDLSALEIYDLRRKELEVLTRRASPQAAWLPDSGHLLYVSFPPGISLDKGAPFGDLKMINVKTGRQRALAKGQMIWLNKVEAFPDGGAVLFPCVSWENVEIEPTGLAVPIVLRKQLLPSRAKQVTTKKASEEKPAAPPEKSGVEVKPGSEEGQSSPTEQVQHEDFVLSEGQPFYPMSCAISPDGKKIAFVRYIWVPGPAQPADDAPQEKQEGSVEKETGMRQGVEFCVANADGTGIVSVWRSEQDENAQVLWVNNTRLLCVVQDKIFAVDTDGQNKLDLTDAIRTKFPDWFRPPAQGQEAMPPLPPIAPIVPPPSAGAGDRRGGPDFEPVMVCEPGWHRLKSASASWPQAPPSRRRPRVRSVSSRHRTESDVKKGCGPEPDLIKYVIV